MTYKPSEQALNNEESSNVEPVNLGRPGDPKSPNTPKKNLAAERRTYRPSSRDTIKVRGAFSAAIDESTPQTPIIVFADGSVSPADGSFHNGRIELRLDDRSAAMLAADLINQLSGPYLTVLYGGADPLRANVFKAFRHQFREDVSADVNAFDMATDYIR